MYKLLFSLLVLAFLGVAFAELISVRQRLETVPSAEEAAVLFAKFKVDFKKSYATAEEEAKRFEYFQNKLKKIVEMNLKSTTATFGIFRFDDESPEEKEFKHKNTVVLTPEDLALQALHKNDSVGSLNINSIDWRNNGMITPVKDQGQCGACWAFGATEMVEVGNWQNGHGYYELAPQQIVDCANGMNQGCNGGNPGVAVQQMIDNQGGNLETNDQYPYLAYQQGQCYYNGQGPAHVSSVSSASGEESIYNVLNYTPVAIFLDATSVENYQSGYLNSGNCEANGVDHVVQAIGCGYWSDGTPVWILKNQWGQGWADYGGYFYVAYGQGACNIQTQAYWSN